MDIKITFLRTSHVSNTWFLKHFSILSSLTFVFNPSINLWLIILMIMFLIDTIKIIIKMFLFNSLLKLNDLGSYIISSSSMHFNFFKKVSVTPLSLYPIRWEFGYLNTSCLVLLNWNAPVYEFVCEIRKELSQIPIESTKEFKKLREAQRKLCSDREKAHSAHRWTLSDHPIRCKTTNRFPPTTNPKPLSALQPSSAHIQTVLHHHPALFQDLPRVCAPFIYKRLG